MNGSLTFTIPGRMPNLNEIIKAKGSGRDRGGRVQSKYTRMKRDETAKVAILAGLGEKTGDRLGKALVVLHHFEPNRKRDQDGIHAGARKFVLDGLVNAQALPFINQDGEVSHGDGWAALAPFVLGYFAVDALNPRIEVKVYWGDLDVVVRDRNP